MRAACDFARVSALVRGNMPRKGLIGRAFLISFFESDVPLVFCGLFRSMDEEEGDEERRVSVCGIRQHVSEACQWVKT